MQSLTVKSEPGAPAPAPAPEPADLLARAAAEIKKSALVAARERELLVARADAADQAIARLAKQVEADDEQADERALAALNDREHQDKRIQDLEAQARALQDNVRALQAFAHRTEQRMDRDEANLKAAEARIQQVEATFDRRLKEAVERCDRRCAEAAARAARAAVQAAPVGAKRPRTDGDDQDDALPGFFGSAASIYRLVNG